MSELKKMQYITKGGTKIDVKNSNCAQGALMLFLCLDANERGDLINNLEKTHREMMLKGN